MLLFIIGALNIAGGMNTQTQVNKLLSLQPLLKKQTILELAIEESVGRMGIYLMSHDEEAKSKFKQSFELTKNSLSNATSDPTIALAPNADSMFSDIENVLEKLLQS